MVLNPRTWYSCKTIGLKDIVFPYVNINLFRAPGGFRICSNYWMCLEEKLITTIGNCNLIFFYLLSFP